MRGPFLFDRVKKLAFRRDNCRQRSKPNQTRGPVWQLDRRLGGRHQHIDRLRLDRRVTIGPGQFRVELCDDQPRSADRRVQVFVPSPALYRPRAKFGEDFGVMTSPSR
jgi:hypothetical protein